MKYLFGTKLRFFWVMIPMAALLALAIAYNDRALGLLKYYPLIVFSSGAIVFTLVYFFRLVGFGFEEIRTMGLFSSRERVSINEGRTLTITKMPARKLQFELFGNDGVLAQLDWLVPEEDGTIPDINLFRAKALGGNRTLLSILKFYGVESSELRESIVNGKSTYEDELVKIESGLTETELRQIHIYFKKTI